ncbi:hypothetical protein NQZ68_014935 [Dissostichus eleginoides]|nr:hypothetical protein NQZ68_014935 [Dissostichus eleginoides]
MKPQVYPILDGAFQVEHKLAHHNRRLHRNYILLTARSFEIQQNLINSAGMEIISARRAQETERDGEEDAWRALDQSRASSIPPSLSPPAISPSCSPTPDNMQQTVIWLCTEEITASSRTEERHSSQHKAEVCKETKENKEAKVQQTQKKS